MTDSATLPASEIAPTKKGSGASKSRRSGRKVPEPPPIPLEMLQGSQEEQAEQPDEQDLERALLRAPPWLVSTVLHMLIFIVLGIMGLTYERKNEIAVEVYSDVPGETLDDSIGSLEDIPETETDVFSALDLPQVIEPIAAPTLADISANANLAGANSSPPGMALAGRGKGLKRLLTRIGGGTPDTQAAVRRALEWFKRNQRADGSWSLKGPYADGGFDEDLPAATAMALLAFQGDGHTHKEGEHRAVVRRGWDALLKMQSPEGQFIGAGLPMQHQLYAHSQCTIALCELYGMTQDPAFRKPAQKALEFCAKAQDPQQGGWRYVPGIDSDLSVTGWFLMALQSAKMANLEVPEKVLSDASKFLDRVQSANGSQYTYTVGGHSTLAMTAEGLLSRQYLGWKRNDQRLMAGANYVSANPIKMSSSERDVYYWYYATQMLHHMEGAHWTKWNDVMKVEVPRAQIKKGREEGSWDPGVYTYGEEGGRLFVTALQTYMLEVYYRHLPLYSNIGRELGQ